MNNCPGQGNLTRTPRFWCTIPEGLAVFYTVLNIFLSITASLGNSLILIALCKVTSVHPPTKLLFRCLALTDLCVGLVLQPLNVSYLLTKFQTEINLYVILYVAKVTYVSGLILGGMSALTSTAISVDRLLALLLGLRYRHVVTLRRVRVIIICFWIIGVSGGLLSFCLSQSITDIAAIIFVVLCVFISGFSYTKIFLTLRQNQAQVQGNPQGQPNGEGIPLNIARYKKTVSSIAWVQLALVVCYLPFIVSVITIQINGWSGKNASIVRISTVTLFYLNSTLNPIVYCWKIKEIREDVKITIRQICCSLS